MDANRNSTVDNSVEALEMRQTQMLKDIVRELCNGEIVFPNCFDVTVRLRKELQNRDLPIARIADIVSAEPLVAAKLVILANSVHYNPGGYAVRDIRAAISRLGMNLVRATTLSIVMKQILH